MATPPQVQPSQRTIHTSQLITAMLKSNGHVSDLIFSPGRPPQIEVSGELVELKFKGLESLSPEDTRFIAYDIMGKNEHPVQKLEQDGSADLSYGIPGLARFRVNIFRQRGTFAIVMRVIPNTHSRFRTIEPPCPAGRNRSSEEWHRPGHRPNRVGKILHARRGHRQDEHRQSLPHSHH